MLGSGRTAAFEVAAPKRATGTKNVEIQTVAYKKNSEGQSLKLTIASPSSGNMPGSGFPILFAIHGGGWVRFDRTNILSDLSSFPAQGYAVVAPDYTLATNRNASWPNNLKDLQDAIDWILVNGDSLGLDTTDITLLGQSAGGHLATMLAIAESGNLDAANGPVVDGLIDISGPVNLPALVGSSTFAAGRAKTMLGQSFDANPALWNEASPIALLQNNTNVIMPPVLIIQGTQDPVVPMEQSTGLFNQLQKMALPVRMESIQGAGHQLLRGSFAANVQGRILSFLKSGLNSISK